MSVTVRQVEARSSVTVWVEGAPVIDGEMYGVGRRMQPTRVVLRWLQMPQGSWWLSIAVFGPAVLRDGTIGTQRQYHSYNAANYPGWLADIVGDYAPPCPDSWDALRFEEADR